MGVKKKPTTTRVSRPLLILQLFQLEAGALYFVQSLKHSSTSATEAHFPALWQPGHLPLASASCQGLSLVAAFQSRQKPGQPYPSSPGNQPLQSGGGTGSFTVQLMSGQLPGRWARPGQTLARIGALLPKKSPSGTQMLVSGLAGLERGGVYGPQ